MKFNPYSVSKEQYDSLQDLCHINTYRVIDVSELPIALPRSLLKKTFEAVVVMGSGANLYNVYMINLLRVDSAAGAIDQQPLIIASSSGNLCSGFIQHGNWEERTIYPPPDLFVAVQGSGIVDYYPYAGVPAKRTGGISELTPDSHRKAFWSTLGLIKF